MKHISVILAFMLALSAGSWGKDPHTFTRFELQQMVKQNVQQQFEEQSSVTGKQKSIPRAVVFSALVPGAGQAYVGSFLKSALFLTVEVAAWAVYFKYNQLGKDKDREFKAFADKYWSEYRYWSYVYYRLKNGNTPSDLPEFNTYTVEGKDWVLIDQDQYETAREILRRYEDTRYLQNFTHRLPETKTQQYYEMIGKYPEQFGNAWEDASFNVFYNGYEGIITPLNDEYMTMRDMSNHFYDIAGYGAMVSLLNHVISAFDAGFSAKRYNEAQKLAVTYRRVVYAAHGVNMFGVSVQL